MKPVEVASRISEYTHSVLQQTNDLVHALCENFVAEDESNNEVASAKYDLHENMAKYIVLAAMNSSFNKQYNTCKKDLDRSCLELGLDTSPLSGEIIKIYKDKQFLFSKKQNVDSEQLSAKDLLIELNKLGVAPDLLKQAEKNATKIRKGNTYYNVEVVE